MSTGGDWVSEMAEKHAQDELQDLLDAGSVSAGSLSPVADFLMRLQAVGTVVSDGVAASHLAMLRDEAAAIPAGVPAIRSSSGPPVRRRRAAFGTLMSGFLVKALIGTAAFASVGTGAAVVSDGAVPGQALYGLDRALESVGINRGGATERIEEAGALVDAGDHRRAVATLEEAIADLAEDAEGSSAVGALQGAVASLTAVRFSDAAGYRDSQLFRDQVAGLIATIATQMESGGVDGAQIARHAKQLSDSAHSFANSQDGAPADAGRPSETPAGPPESVGSTKPDTPPGRSGGTDRRP